LRPYQSTSIDRADYDDGMLNDWGIQHFHLGAVPYAKAPQFMDRTGPLLYAVVTAHTLYCLTVLKHKEWSNQKLLDVMHENFPEVTAGATLTSWNPGPPSLSVNYSDDEVAKLRAAGANAVTQRPDGTIMFGPGGGVTLDGRRGKQSAKVAQAVVDVRKAILAMENSIRDRINGTELAVPANGLDLRLTEIDGKLVAADSATGLQVEIGEPVVRSI